MATDTLSSPTVSASGYEMTITTSGTLAGAITVDPTKITMSGTDEVNGTTSTDTRVNNIISATVSGSTLTCRLRNPWHDDSTSITIALAEAAFTDADGDVNAALGSTAVTNNSTLDYAKPTIHIATSHLDRVTGEYEIIVVAVGPAYLGYRSNFGIAKVTVDELDAGASTTTYEATAHSSYTRNGSYGKHATVYNVYKITGTAVGKTAGVATLTPKAYPRIGDAGAIATGSVRYVYLDPSDAFDHKTAYVDRRGTAALSSGISADIADGDFLSGNTSGFEAIINGAASSGATSINLGYHKGTPSSGENVTIKRYPAGTTIATATLDGVPTWNADAGTPALGDRDNPYKSFVLAATAIEAASSSASVSHSTMYMMEGWHMGDGQWNAPTHLGAAIIRPDPLSSNVKWYGLGGILGRTHCVKIVGVDTYIQANTAYNTDSGVAGGGSGPIHDAAKQFLILEGFKITGVGRTVTTVSILCDALFECYFEGIWLYNTYNGGFTSQVIKDCKFEYIASDATSPHNNSLNINSTYIDLSPGGTAAHGDVCQFSFAGPTTNFTMFGFACDDDEAGGQPAPFCNGTAGSPTLSQIAFVHGTQPSNAAASLADLESVTVSSYYWYGNVHADTYNHSGSTVMSNGWFVGNVSNNINGNTTATWGAVSEYNHSVSETNMSSYETTTGSTIADLFEDPTTTFDWTPKLGTDIINALPNEGEWIWAYDPDGVAINTSGGSAIGTYQAAAPSITSVDPSSVANAATGTLTFTGTGFITGATVSVDAGLTLGTLTVNSATEAECTYEATAEGTSTVTITNPDGQTDTITVEVTASGGGGPDPEEGGLGGNIIYQRATPAGRSPRLRGRLPRYP